MDCDWIINSKRNLKEPTCVLSIGYAVVVNNHSKTCLNIYVTTMGSLEIVTNHSDAGIRWNSSLHFACFKREKRFIVPNAFEPVWFMFMYKWSKAYSSVVWCKSSKQTRQDDSTISHSLSGSLRRSRVRTLSKDSLAKHFEDMIYILVDRRWIISQISATVAIPWSSTFPRMWTQSFSLSNGEHSVN